LKFLGVVRKCETNKHILWSWNFFPVSQYNTFQFYMTSHVYYTFNKIYDKTYSVKQMSASVLLKLNLKLFFGIKHVTQITNQSQILSFPYLQRVAQRMKEAVEVITSQQRRERRQGQIIRNSRAWKIRLQTNRNRQVSGFVLTLKVRKGFIVLHSL